MEFLQRRRHSSRLTAAVTCNLCILHAFSSFDKIAGEAYPTEKGSSIRHFAIYLAVTVENLCYPVCQHKFVLRLTVLTALLHAVSLL